MKRLIGAFGAKGAGFTLYASKNDRALLLSGIANWEQRAGYVSGGQPVIIAGADTVDVTNAGNYFATNHDLYIDSPILKNDMRHLFENGQRPPDKRTPQFEAVTVKSGVFWRLRATASVAEAAAQ